MGLREEIKTNFNVFNNCNSSEILNELNTVKIMQFF